MMRTRVANRGWVGGISGLLLMAVLAAPAALEGESLGEAAAREKARREEVERAGQVAPLTEKELAQGRPSPTPTPESAAPPAAPAALPGAEAEAGPSMTPPDDEHARLVESFRARYAEAVAAVDKAEEALKAAARELDAIPDVRLATPEMYYARHAAQERVRRAQAGLAQAEAQRDAIEDEARRAGLYPGDLRSS